MWTCLDSDRRVRVACFRALASVAVFAAMLAASVAGAKSSPDSLGTVSRVSVSPHGIVVQRSGDVSDTLFDRVDVKIGDVQIDVHDENYDNDEAALVRIFSDIEVPKGQHVLGDVVAVFGSVDVAGRVDGDVVAAMGSVTLRDSAIVHGEVVSVGGGLNQAPTASVSGESVSLDFFPLSWGIPGLSVMLASIFACALASWLFGWLFAVVFPERLVRVAHVTSHRTAASLGLGILAVPGSLLLCILLMMTIIGIPLALLLPFAYLIFAIAGQQAATYLLGCKLLGRRVGQGGLVAPITAGTLFVTAFFVLGALLTQATGARLFAMFFVLLGCLLVAVLSATGTGAFFLSRFGSRPAEVNWSGVSPPGTSPSPASPTPIPTS